jgi:hypothetical protein
MIASLCPQIGNTQEMAYNNGKIFYKGNFYDKSNVHSIMMASPEAYRLFNESIHSSRNINSYAIGGAISSILSIYITLDYRRSYEESPLLTKFFLAPISFALIAVTGGVGLTLFAAAISNKQIAHRRMNEAINHFNWEVNQLKDQDTSYLKIGISKNGLGLSYHF